MSTKIKSSNLDSDLEITGTFTANTFVGSVSGSATSLETARTIGGVSFDGTANINLPGVNIGGNQNTTGSAASLTTARTITIGSTGKSFDGSANVSWSLSEIGVGTLGQQNSNSVTITGGTINGTSIGESAPATISGTTGSFSGQLTLNGQTSGANSGLSLSTQSTQVYNLRSDPFDGINVNVRWRQSGASAGENFWLWSAVDNAARAISLNPSSRTLAGADFLAFATGSTIGPVSERMRIDSTGNVGIGTSSPSQKLTIAGGRIGTDNNQGFAIRDTGGTYRNVISLNSSNATVIGNTATNNRIFIEAGGSGEAVRITSAGNVGIGATSPTSALTVQGTITGTAVTQSATDTTAGRLTKVGDFGLGTNSTPGLIDGASTNRGARTQFFQADSVDRPTEWNVGILETQNIGGWIVHRGSRPLAFLFPNGPRLFLSYRSSASWSTPVEFYTQGNILGTVSQSSGVPTGAIIQRGSNANGEFVRFADGTQICSVRGLTLPRLMGFDNIMETMWVFPASFTSTTNLSTSMSIRNNAANFVDFTGWSSAQVRQRMTSSFANTRLSTNSVFIGQNFDQTVPSEATLTGVCATAIGRWY